MVHIEKAQMKTEYKDNTDHLPIYFDDQPFYTSERYFDGAEEQPVRPGMLLTLTSGLCFLLAGIGLMTAGTKKPKYDVTKYAIGVVMLVIALLAFFTVAFMCVKHFIRLRDRQERLASIITRHAYADHELLEISVQHVQEQSCRNCNTANKPKFLPITSSYVISEENESVYNKKTRLFGKYKQIIKTLS